MHTRIALKWPIGERKKKYPTQVNENKYWSKWKGKKNLMQEIRL